MVSRPVVPDVYWEKIGDVTLSTAATSVSFDGLDLDSDGLYLLIFYDVNASSTDSNWIKLYFNDDTTATNYYRQYIQGDNTTVGSARANNADLFMTSANKTGLKFVWIMKTPNNYPKCIGLQDWEDTGLITQVNSFVRVNTENVTKITVHSRFTNQFGVGSRFILLKYSG